MVIFVLQMRKAEEIAYCNYKCQIGEQLNLLVN